MCNMEKMIEKTKERRLGPHENIFRAVWCWTIYINID